MIEHSSEEEITLKTNSPRYTDKWLNRADGGFGPTKCLHSLEFDCLSFSRSDLGRPKAVMIHTDKRFLDLLVLG